MKKIHVDTTMGVHLSNGIAHIILGSDDLSKKFYKDGDNETKTNLKTESIITMPIAGLVQTLNILQNFSNEPHIKMILDSYADIGVLKKDK